MKGVIMKIQEIMTKNFEMINTTDSLTNAAQQMKKLDVGVLPVREGDRIVGIITDRDIIIRALAEQRAAGSTLVKDVMSGDIQCCRPEDSLEDAARLMQEKQVRRLIVLDQENSPVGIVSLGDIAAKSHADELAGETLEEISRPAAPAR